ncbi:hypothetical protein RFI_17543 [Reticulomyxa filosa]|uniref:Uncharacterized protein n=1 Tax=Reticulomyxa filosa TaxID=46433 RepID=X6N2Z2_RETFI|nr:hypothetical protein RFI_17543 [Reticulomyxa filosa]|eukprot:ETO19687.1 hypothetical protein RFI_17543 [Reticulomyxa filosa]
MVVFQTQLKDRNVSIHEKVFGVVVAMAKLHPDIFGTYVVIYIKKMMAHLATKDTKSITACDKAITEILKTTTDSSFNSNVGGMYVYVYVYKSNVLNNREIGSGIRSGSPRQVVYSAKVLFWTNDEDSEKTEDVGSNGNVIVATVTVNGDGNSNDETKEKRNSGVQLAQSGYSSFAIAKDTLDVVTDALKSGLKDNDKVVRTEAMECVNALKKIDIKRSEQLVSNMPAQFRKSYLQKYGETPLCYWKVKTAIHELPLLNQRVFFFFFFFFESHIAYRISHLVEQVAASAKRQKERQEIREHTANTYT